MKGCGAEIPALAVIEILNMLFVSQTSSEALPQPVITSGRDFVLAYPLHKTPTPGLEYRQLLLLSNPSPRHAANVTVDAPLTDNTTTAGMLDLEDDVSRVLIPPATSLFLHIDLGLMVTSDGVEDKGIHVSSDRDIAVQMVSGTDSNERQSVGATLIYPSSTLQAEYWVATQCPKTRCYISIVGAEAGQTVVVVGVRTESPAHVVQFQGQQYQNGNAIVSSVHQFQAMQLLCEPSGCSMSGTLILTSRPVAVFVGAVFAKIGGNGDTYFEQIPPLPPTGPPVGEPQISLSNYTYILARLREGNAVEEVKVVAHENGTTVVFSTGEKFTSAEDSEVHTVTFSGDDMGVVTVTANSRITVTQLTDKGYLPSRGKDQGDETSLMPLPTAFWGSSCLLALPDVDMDVKSAFGKNMVMTVVVSSWQEGCLYSENTEILHKLLAASSENEVDSPAVVRVEVTWGITAVVSSQCGPISGQLWTYTTSMAWTLALASLNWTLQVMETGSTATTTTTSLTPTLVTAELLQTHNKTVDEMLTDKSTSSEQSTTAEPANSQSGNATSNSSSSSEYTGQSTESATEAASTVLKYLTPQQVSAKALTTKPITAKLLTTQPITTKLLTTQPITTKLLPTQPITTKLQTKQPVLAHADVYSQSITEQLDTTQPITVEHVTSQPTTGQQPAVTGQTKQPETTTATAAASPKMTKRNLCPCSPQARASQLSVESQTEPLSISHTRQEVEESIREEVSKALSMDKTSLSSTRRSKFSEDEMKIAYGIGLAGALLFILQLMWSAYKVHKYGPEEKQSDKSCKRRKELQRGEHSKTRHRKQRKESSVEQI